ncbi:hypothetical protein BbiDN127_I0030 (plasmid) [Borreliella bissettiae DN127]|uniref:Uncharacterized protein n=1 Tax=Borrelia bissettiae (strain DSM 17990 / CIP 109136 / DN127) TaxID=521010 RepID=G0AP80_BORBD|nr:hypothetical protein BbiDN127_I0030 [Borreliella bissettiae DN127]
MFGKAENTNHYFIPFMLILARGSNDRHKKRREQFYKFRNKSLKSGTYVSRHYN